MESVQKLISSSTSWSVTICQISDPSLSGFSDILLTRLFIHSRKKGHNSRTTRPMEEKKIRVRLFFMYMPYIKFQDSSIRFNHKVVPIQNAYLRKRGITQPKIYGIGSKVNQFIYILVCNNMPNIRILALAVFQIFCKQGCSFIVEKGA